MGTLLLPLPPPGVIFAPGRGPAVRGGLQTADHIRLASPVQEEEGAPATGDRTWIMRLAVFNAEDRVALRFAHRRPTIFSALLPYLLPSIASRWHPHGRTSEVFLR